jgi:four helix bundle protein
MAIEITSETYRLTRTFPRSERYGLVQQMNRASVSIASNILKAPGGGIAVTLHDFFASLEASGCELEAQVTMAPRVGLVDGEAARVLRERIEKLKASITNLETRMFGP